MKRPNVVERERDGNVVFPEMRVAPFDTTGRGNNNDNNVQTYNNNEKVNAVRNHGGPTVSIRLHGMNYDEAAEEANRLVEEEGLSLIHPFDDPEV